MDDNPLYDDELRAFLAAYDQPNVDPGLDPSQRLAKKVIDNNRHRNFRFELIVAREKQHLTQTQLAKIVGTTQSVIATVEGKKGNPRLDTLLKIAEALDVRLRLTP